MRNNSFKSLGYPLIILLLSLSASSLYHPRALRQPLLKGLRKGSTPLQAEAPEATTNFIDMPINHYTNNGDVSNTYSMRYLTNEDEFDVDTGVILFYAGNEDKVTNYWDNSGYITNVLAPELKGMLVFGEHRYFGESMPFGTDSYNKENLVYFTAEQAMFDYVLLIKSIQQQIKDANGNEHDVPVIVFGGSYGGMLASWLRLKYPHVFHGALASSAPILYFEGSVSPYAFNQATTEAYDRNYPTCSSLLRDGFQYLIDYRTKSDKYDQIGQIFNLCEPPSSPSEVDAVINFANGAFGSMAMVNYPYPTSYLNPMPGNPVDTACEAATTYTIGTQDPKGDVLAAMNEAVLIYYNSDGDYGCLDLYAEPTEVDPDNDGWDVLYCNEMVMPFAQSGVTDMFLPAEAWDEVGTIEWCEEAYGLTPQFYWALDHFGGRNPTQDFSHCSNLIFSNGMIDPWHVGGVQYDVGSNCKVINIEDSAHHLDLRMPDTDLDPQSVLDARDQETALIKGFIADYYNLYTAQTRVVTE